MCDCYIRDVAQKLRYLRFGEHTESGLCPCGHARDSPGAHFFFNPTVGCGRCHARHGPLWLTDLCSVPGIDVTDYGGIYASRG
ncbi:MAG: hypothetical protein H7Y09_08525 [Chitinophagaceae bacterium]|nr:hypothetical protein [Anaerolineae bacterium]